MEHKLFDSQKHSFQVEQNCDTFDSGNIYSSSRQILHLNSPFTSWLLERGMYNNKGTKWKKRSGESRCLYFKDNLDDCRYWLIAIGKNKISSISFFKMSVVRSELARMIFSRETPQIAVTFQTLQPAEGFSYQ